jgi:hypothetical protein
LACRNPDVLPRDLPLNLVILNEKVGGLGGGAFNDTDGEEERISEAAKEQILRFIKGLLTRDLLSDVEAESLRRLLAENSSILFAAYSVALSSNDATYLAEICRDLALSLGTEAGRLACEAQAEVCVCVCACVIPSFLHTLTSTLTPNLIIFQ